jgi:hypothetical protein
VRNQSRVVKCPEICVVERNTGVPTMTENQIVQSKPMRRKTVIHVLLLIAVILFFVVAIVNIPNFRGMFEARQVFRAFSEALIAKDYAMAYNLIAPETKANVSYEKFVEIENKLGERAGTLHSFSTNDMETKGDDDNLVTMIHANFRFDKETLQFEYVLKKEHGLWFVYRFDEM